MGKKLIFAIIILALISLTAVFAFQNNTQDFDGLFTMNVPFGEKFEDVAYCLPNGRLGCAKEYWDVDSCCELEDDDIVVYYYDDSYLVEGESNAYDHAIGTLTTSYLYNFIQNDGKLIILSNDIGMRNMPPYLVGVVSDDGNKVVFVGGYNLNNLKTYANSVEFK